jgi:hypothetical protein
VVDKSAPRNGRLESINRPEYESLRFELSRCFTSAGISQRSVSLKLGKGEEWVNRILVGRRTVEWSELLDICNAIGADPEQVIIDALRGAKKMDL